MFFIKRHNILILAAIAAAHLYAADGHWQVSTVEGIEQGKPTQFTTPYNPVCIDDNLYLIDNMSCVRKIDLKTREVSTIAGRKEPTAKHIHNDFIGSNAVFNHPQYITSDGSKGLFMTTPQEVIRIDIAAGNTVYKIAGNSAKKPEKFHFLHGITHFGSNLYVTDYEGDAIHQINLLTKNTSTIATGIKNPLGISCDTDGNLYFSHKIPDSNTCQVSKIMAGKEKDCVTYKLSTLKSIISVEAITPPEITCVGSIIYLTDLDNNQVIKITQDTKTHDEKVISSIITAELNNPCGITSDNRGNLYVADTSSNQIKKVSFISATFAENFRYYFNKVRNFFMRK